MNTNASREEGQLYLGLRLRFQSSVLAQLVDFLRTRPQTGKHTIVETIPWSEYSIGLLPGRRGGVVKILKREISNKRRSGTCNI